MTETIRRWLDSLAQPGRPDEHETKTLLRQFGLSIPKALRVEAGATAAQMPDFDPPYVVKVRSAQILHKTDRGGVLTSVSREELAAAESGMLERFPGCGLLVEEQVRFEGMEFILGAFHDPSFGPALMAGAGGILTELYKDVAFRLVPCPADEALRMLKELRVFPVLDGFRGMRMDAPGLAETISRVGDLVAELGEALSQLDINPLVSSRGEWTVLDAKLALRPGGA
jgi:succinyl-CoA synthetase beta subunit